jgi:ribonuclease VapC
MIVDTSAIVAVVRADPERARYRDAISAADNVAMSAASYLEACIVIDRSSDPSHSRLFDDLLTRMGVAVEPVTVEQARIARQAYRDFGKGSGHPAQLNFGDCFSYALAIDTGEALLYKGADFRHAGIRSALPD